MLDLKITGGTIVDGTGSPGFRGDIGIKGGRIVAIGKVGQEARETIDATGRIVSPGFIDAHTHYDAQVFWDPKLTPSCFHGVTTVVGGFCGFSIAPITPEAAGYIKSMLARVEGMPLATLQAAVPWNWRSFADYLQLLDGKIGLNAGFFAGHSAIRRVAMGERAVGEKATPQDLEKMKALLDSALADGAMGFSTTVAPTHNDAEGNPVPSRWADRDEIIELAKIVSRHEGTGLELLPDLDFGPGMAELLADFSVAGNRPVNWNVLNVYGRPDAEEMVNRQLEVTNFARQRGGEVIALTIPCLIQPYINLRTGFIFDALPGVWRKMFKWPLAERMEKMRDPAFRQEMARDAVDMPPGAAMQNISQLEAYKIVSVHADGNQKYLGRRISDIAAAEGSAAIDVMVDIALRDNLNTVFAPEMGADDQASYELRGRLWNDDRTLVGASDAGAHLDMVDTFAFATTMLERGVRQHKVISLEKAVQKITQRPAQYFGLVDRGVLTKGYHADIVVFDADTIGRDKVYNRYDVPGGHDFRIYAEALGVDHVLVNGVEIVTKGEHTGKLPGTVLRSGRDTRTVRLDALRERHSAELEPA